MCTVLATNRPNNDVSDNEIITQECTDEKCKAPLRSFLRIFSEVYYVQDSLTDGKVNFEELMI